MTATDLERGRRWPVLAASDEEQRRRRGTLRTERAAAAVPRGGVQRRRRRVAMQGSEGGGRRTWDGEELRWRRGIGVGEARARGGARGPAAGPVGQAAVRGGGSHVAAYEWLGAVAHFVRWTGRVRRRGVEEI